MNKCKLFTIIFLLPLAAFAQLDVGLEGQVYPAGFMIGPRIGYQISENGNVYLKVSQNIAKRQDFGEHENEEGGGPGFTLGFDHFFKNNWYIGLRNDLWWMTIDWKEDTQKGSTDITVVQPTLIGGYQFNIGQNLSVNPHVAYGLEVNVVSKGEDVGQGTILLGGIHVKYSLRKPD